ncbi:hypothetical protein BDR06DRAFT_953079 [Suillus hirtellus]|nr:hypothetical protein BDR06DRAFT_953079 [Suillus hirtellus]
MSGLEESLYALDWNNNISVAIITLVSYDYMLQFEKEQRQRSIMTYMYLAVRYFGISIAMYVAAPTEPSLSDPALGGGLFYIPETVSYAMFLFFEWSFSVYFCLAEVILILRLYALYNRSKPILYVLLGLFLPVVALYIAIDAFLWSRPSSISMQEIIITPDIKYCTAVFHIGPMPAIYASIPIICYDIILLILAVAVLGKHLKERNELRMKPNAYVVMIVRYHVIYFVLNLATQIFMAILWANLPTPMMYLAQFFINTAPIIILPRLIISIWETHANENCVHVSTTFEDCICWASPQASEQHEMDCL